METAKYEKLNNFEHSSRLVSAIEFLDITIISANQWEKGNKKHTFLGDKGTPKKPRVLQLERNVENIIKSRIEENCDIDSFQIKICQFTVCGRNEMVLFRKTSLHNCALSLSCLSQLSASDREQRHTSITVLYFMPYR